MKSTLLIILSLFVFAVANAQEKDGQNAMYAPFETIITDLNNDSIPDTIAISMPPVEGDPGQFRKINISLGTAGRNTFTAKDAWDDIDTTFLKNNANAVKSKRIFVYKENDTSYIVLFGFTYGSGRDELDVIAVTGSKLIQLANDNIQNPIQFADLDNDGKAELICRNDYEIFNTDRKTKGDIGTYSPYMVYKCENVLYLDKKLSETYNKQHYVWAGYKYNQHIKVLYPITGKPQIMK
ncbi:hypothetical protein R1T16_15935 [Flavobacterium sp. DG1-102-2]|uniref:hypothetical protein n=1 Tax=Flavobacterium sp. DG1-102-2 TaxID=3081663 RepID=UPI0029496EF2|nr:hypothetical protein [Flavobacterium sp. DG1-102-2]MDV6169928.1 hypothetical protein [Flavobacterium sp. DG1-102-2]